MPAKDQSKTTFTCPFGTFAYRRELDEVFFKHEPILKNNLPVEILGDPPPPKGDPVFELKPLPDTLKYAYLDEKKIYPVIINAIFQSMKKRDY